LSLLPAGGGGAASSVAGGQDPVLCRRGVTGRLVSGYSLPPPAPPNLSRIVVQNGACVESDGAQMSFDRPV